MQIQISWLLQKPTDLDLHCLQRQGISGSAGQGLMRSMWAKTSTLAYFKEVFTTKLIWQMPFFLAYIPYLLEVFGHLTILFLKFEQVQFITRCCIQKLLDGWQTVYILMRRHVLWCLIWIYTVCSGLSVQIHTVNMVQPKLSEIGWYVCLNQYHSLG